MQYPISPHNKINYEWGGGDIRRFHFGDPEMAYMKDSSQTEVKWQKQEGKSGIIDMKEVG